MKMGIREYFHDNNIVFFSSILPSPVEANCTFEKSVTEIDESLGIAVAFFQCFFNKEYVTEDVSSLQITSTEGVAGLPINNSTLINPKLSDDAIEEGLLTNPAYSGGDPPSIINSIDYLVKYNEDQGIFIMVFEFIQGTVNVEVDQNFEIPFVYQIKI